MISFFFFLKFSIENHIDTIRETFMLSILEKRAVLQNKCFQLRLRSL